MTRRRTGAGPPRTIVVLAAAGALFFALPVVALVVRVPWSRIVALLTAEVALDALRISLVTSVAATLVAVVFGLPLAFVLARSEFRGRALLRGVVLLPLVLPPVVGGAALLFALGRRGVVGEALADATGVILPFSTGGVIVAATFVAMPFLVVTVEGALRNLDDRYEKAAASLGAGPWFVLRRVTLPLLAPSIGAGLLLTWARALGEFGATITFAGNLQGRTQSLPLAVFVALERDRDTALALSVLLMAVSLAIIVGLRRRWTGVLR